MENPSGAHYRRPPKILRVIRARPRLAALFALVVGALLPGNWRAATRVLVGWDAGVAFYLIAAFTLLRAEVGHIRRRALVQDEGRFVILVLVVAAALASLGAILAQLDAGRAPGNLVLAMLTILLSWAFVHVIFALHYAHEFYAVKPRGGGLTFPGGEDPDYWDFLYFSLVIGMTSQVSDLAVTGRTIRRTWRPTASSRSCSTRR